MEVQFANLKGSFGEITEVQKQIKNYFEIVQVKINKLKQFHSEFVHKNQNSDLFVFGLDSLNFQSKLIDMEFDEMRRIYFAIGNRIYCEYYKLFKIIVNYISSNFFDKKILELVKGSTFPVYRDLEPYKEYEFHFVVEAHESILLLLNAICGALEAKNTELQFHIAKRNIGLNIDNFISSFTFDVTMMREKLNLFVAYLVFFHSTHLKQLNRFRNKLQSLYSFICKDIRFDESLNISTENADSLSSSRNLTEDYLSDEEEQEVVIRRSSIQPFMFDEQHERRNENLNIFLLNEHNILREENQQEEEKNNGSQEDLINDEHPPGITLDQVINES